MNRYYLMQHISYHLHTLVRCYSINYELLESFSARIDFRDDKLEKTLVDYFSSVQQDIPVFLSINQQYIYAWIPAADQIFIVGPVTFPTPIYIKNQKFISSLNNDLLESIPICEFNDFTADVLLIANLYRQQSLDKQILLLENCFIPQIEEKLEKSYSEIVFENHEIGKSHNPYDQEVREFISIEKGNIEQLRKSLTEDYPGEIGTLARTPLRHMKNRGIVIITLASRAAMRGGVLPEIAYSLSDSYIQKIEDCDDIPTIMHLFHAAEYRYAQMVQDLSEAKSEKNSKYMNPYTDKCKAYIFSHLHEKISIHDMAIKLNVRDNYLSEVFQKYENMTLTDYIHKEKIKLTQNLLIYSRYTYSEIATYLGFYSQSHLGKLFKKQTEMTLRQYRLKYGVKEFI
ncbi:MAG: helix-turn-helix domain-containing protein [Lachnotalea sp.]